MNIIIALNVFLSFYETLYLKSVFLGIPTPEHFAYSSQKYWLHHAIRG